MKPIKLEIEGLNSFENKVTINFDELTKYGIFGIFGKTGSGKSTILDAITLALYGNVVRLDMKNAQGIEELLNINWDQIYVKFIFKLAEDTYSIERWYVRKKPKKNSDEIDLNETKVEFSKRDVRMIINDNEIYDKITDVRNKINEIIGLNLEDFTRSVVLPQGKFSEFLKLSGIDRRNMLERIFNLEKYGKNIIDNIGNRKRDISSKIDEFKTKIDIEENVSKENLKLLSELLTEKNNEKKELIEKKELFESMYKEKENIYRQNIELKKHMDEENILISQEKFYKSIDEDIEKARKSSEIIKLYNENNDIQGKIKENSNKKEKLNNEIDRIKKEIDNINLELEKSEYNFKQNDEKYINLKKINSKNDNLTKINIIYENGENNKKIVQTETINIDKSTIDLNNKNIEKTKLDEKIKIEIENLNRYKKHDYKLIDLKNIEKIKLEAKISELESIEEEIILLEKKIDENDLNSKKYRLELEKYEDELNKLKDREMEYIISKLRMDLSKGDKCPVCGSLEHKIDKNIEIDLDKKSFDNYYEIEKDLDTNITNLRVNISKKDNHENNIRLVELKEKRGKETSINLKKYLEILNKEIDELDKLNTENENNISKTEKLVEEHIKKEKEISGEIVKLTTQIEEKKNIISSSIEAMDILIMEIKKLDEGYVTLIDKKYKVNKDKIKEDTKIMNDNVILMENIDKENRKLRLDIDNYNNSLKKENDLYNKYEMEIFKLSTEITQLEKEIENSSKLIDKILLESKIENIDYAKKYYKTENEIEKIINELKIYNENRAKNSAIIENLTKKLNGKTVSIEEWEKLNINKKNIDSDYEIILKDVERITFQKQEMDKKLNDKEENIKEYNKLKKKFDVIDELSKLFSGNKFVEFLAISKLREISYEASERLIKMTNGRYGLVLDKIGEFLIKDNYNGGVCREVKTLSGGETFLASLSLALALSKHVQLRGKVKLEFFFLDEGFGTLDSELLDKVIFSLENLSKEEIIIGLISHVDELKMRLPAKIEVLPAISGVKGATILV